MGIISGACGALFAISGPPMVLYYKGVIDDKETYMAVLQFTQVIQGLALILMRFAFGLWPAGVFSYLPALLAGTAVGAVLGWLAFRKLDSRMFSRVVYLMMLLAGIYFVFGYK